MERIVVEIIHTGQIPKDYQIFDTQEVRIGRGYQNDCIITDPFVSENHCILRKEGDGWVLIDEESENGTYSRKQRKEVKKIRIEFGDEVVIGKTCLRFLSTETSVEPAKLLILKSKSHRRLSQGVNSWSLILLTLLIYAVNTHLESFERLSFNKLMAVSLWQMVSVLIWASIWSFVGRLIKHRTQFWGQVSVTCLFWIILVPASFMLEAVGYLSGSLVFHSIFFALVISALFTALLTRNLSIATNLSRLKQIMISGTISFLIVSIGSISYFAFKDEFNPMPSYYAQLQPPFIKVRSSQKIDDFIKDSSGIFDKSKKKAQRAF